MKKGPDKSDPLKANIGLPEIILRSDPQRI